MGAILAIEHSQVARLCYVRSSQIFKLFLDRTSWRKCV